MAAEAEVNAIGVDQLFSTVPINETVGIRASARERVRSAQVLIADGLASCRAWTSQDRLRVSPLELITQGRGDQRWVELVRCQPSHRERILWSEMKDRSRWLSGWQSIPED